MDGIKKYETIRLCVTCMSRTRLTACLTNFRTFPWKLLITAFFIGFGLKSDKSNQSEFVWNIMRKNNTKDNICWYLKTILLMFLNHSKKKECSNFFLNKTWFLFQCILTYIMDFFDTCTCMHYNTNNTSLHTFILSLITKYTVSCCYRVNQLSYP